MTKQFGTPGPRAIYPEMCDSPSLGRCSILANALFPRLVAKADDQGRLAGDAYGLLVQCMGRHMRDVRVDQLEDALAELEGAGVLARYAAEGAQYVQLLSWWRWQTGQRRAYPSRWPAPPGWRDLVYGCAAAPGLDRFEDALAASPRRNAAIRGNPPQPAAVRGNPPLARRAPMRAPVRAPDAGGAVPRHADTGPSAGAPEGPGGPRGGPPSSVGESLSEFRSRVPRPGEEVQP
jgi:hypothetical protein